MLQTLWNLLAERFTKRRRVNALTQAMRARSAAMDPLQATDRPGEAFEATWRQGVKRRVVFALCAVALWATGVEARLVYLQVLRHDDYVERANHQQNQKVTPVGIRGDIMDRNGEILAYSVPGDMIVGYPKIIRRALEAKAARDAEAARNTKAVKNVGGAKDTKIATGAKEIKAKEIKDAPAIVGALCDAFQDCTLEERAELVKRLSSPKDTVFLRRAMYVTPEQSARVRDLNLEGIGLVPESRRAYPKLELASSVLGFVGVENAGLGGIERAFDGAIRGHEGLIYTQVDGHNRGMEIRVEQEATAGATIELTIDQYVQNIAERELKAGVEAHHADSGTAVVMNPQTGEILALASYPFFDPNDLQRGSADDKKNRAIQDVYEPGSTFKIVTASAAIQEGVFTTTDPVDCEHGLFYIGKRPITDAKGHNFGIMPFEDVIVMSSNVGATKIGLKVGAERFARYVQRFGFGQALLPNFKRVESPGILPNLKAISDSTLASMSMGYEISVTPLQMASAVSAVANGGTLYEPHLVRATVRDGARAETAPKPLREAITRETAATLTSIMEDVVRRGTGKKAQISGYQVAGKTGTAYKAIPGGYSKTDYHASFVGFVPSRQPALAIVVMVDTPRGGVYFGGDVAAPIFKRIAEASLQYLGVPHTINPAPSIVVSANDAAPNIIPTRIALSIPAPLDLSRMPDVRGLGLRDAVQVLVRCGLEVHPSGSGVVSAQLPLPGAAIMSGDSSTLQLTRQPAAAPAIGGSRR